MDETTISDIKQRAERWCKTYYARNGSESERTWIFAVNIDDVNLLIHAIEGLQKENEDLRLQLQAARDHQDVLPHWTVGVDWACPECDKTLTLDQAEAEFRRQPMRVILDSEALEPDAPDGQIKYWFNIASGPYRAPDTDQERGFSWARGPFVSWAAADEGWKDYIKRQRENGQP